MPASREPSSPRQGPLAAISTVRRHRHHTFACRDPHIAWVLCSLAGLPHETRRRPSRGRMPLLSARGLDAPSPSCSRSPAKLPAEGARCLGTAGMEATSAGPSLVGFRPRRRGICRWHPSNIANLAAQVTVVGSTEVLYQLVFGIGFVSVDDKSATRDSVNGPGDELRQLILRFCNAQTELVVQDTQLKAVIESKLGVKCWTGDRVVEEVIWGLRYVMPQFVSKEMNKITDDYFYPLSKQLLHDLETYGIVSTTASQTAGDLRSKSMSPSKDAVKAIADCDKQEILKFLETLSDICIEKKHAVQMLREIEAQIGVSRITVSDEAVGKDDESKTHTKGSSKDGGSGKKCEPMENGRSANKGKRVNQGKTKAMENGRSSNKGKTSNGEQWIFK